MKSSKAAALLVLSCTALLWIPAASAAFVPQGPKLVGTGAVGAVSQGWSVAISADGNTAVVGGPDDNSSAGAAWVYTRSGGVWTQQGSKLVGTGAVGVAYQGSAVALSADGNTAIVGGLGDNSVFGAAWVWTRSGGVWTQQGSKLVGTGAVGFAGQGWSVAISADGNAAVVGGPNDNSFVGAAWVWTRSGSVWTQQGSRLVGTGMVGAARLGWSVALSADGNTAVVGGEGDNSFAGAAWVWTRSGGIWTQQGAKLVGAGAVGSALQGGSVALSADGNTAVVGGVGDNSAVGAAWVWTRSGGVWAQQGFKLVGTGAVGSAYQGSAVTLSADGNTVIVGGPYDDSPDVGAAWVYTRSGTAWTQQGSKLVGTGAVGAANQGSAVALSADGNTAIVGGTGDASGVGAAWVYVTQPAETTYTVTYDGNGNTGGTAPTDGSSPYASGATVTVLANSGVLSRTGFTFNNWNTAANGTGTAYAPAATFAITADTTLYAQWTATALTYTVTYDGNGSTGGAAPADGSSPYASGATVTVLADSGALSRTGFTFKDWNTAANGGGTSYDPGMTFAIAANTTLYAQWTAAFSATSVPTLSGWGAILLSGLMALAGLLYLRRWA